MEKPILFTFRFAHFTFLYPNVQTIHPERNAENIDMLLSQNREKIIIDGAMGSDVIERLEKQIEEHIAARIQKPQLIIYDPRGLRLTNYHIIENMNELEKNLTPKDSKKKKVRKS